MVQVDTIVTISDSMMPVRPNNIHTLGHHLIWKYTIDNKLVVCNSCWKKFDYQIVFSRSFTTPNLLIIYIYDTKQFGFNLIQN